MQQHFAVQTITSNFTLLLMHLSNRNEYEVKSDEIRVTCYFNVKILK